MGCSIGGAVLRLAISSVTSPTMIYLAQDLYPVSKPLLSSTCSNAHHPANLDNLRPPMPLDLPCAAMAAKRSKKSKIILVRASESTLRGIKVAKASRAISESAEEGVRHPVSVEAHSPYLSRQP